MRVLILSGLGPGIFTSPHIEGSLFTKNPHERGLEMLRRAGLSDLDLERLSFMNSGREYALLRPRPDAAPHLTSVTLHSILEHSGHDFAPIDLADVWADTAEVPAGDFDLALLSTTYIWNAALLSTAIRWISQNLPGTGIITGGQFTNLKYMQALRDHPEVTAVVRGDGEITLPMTLDVLDRRGDLATVPNLVWRDDARIRINPVEYIDIDAYPSPSFSGNAAVVPYESMRGCPFDCKFCSFPAASPKWRYKSAEKIRDDWAAYVTKNNAQSIYAMDSTFTIPPTRLRKLLEILPDSGIPPWEGFSRANTLNSERVVDGLTKAHCFQLHIGFESMNDGTLKRMSKRVSVKQNKRAIELLIQSNLSYYGLFMVGYPGESPDMFQDTQDFLVNSYEGHYSIARFSITDETMPLWQDKEELRIVAEDPTNPTSPWSHIGMDSDEAAALQKETMDKVRLKNDNAVLDLWQYDYAPRLMPNHDHKVNLAVEKAIERICMAPLDYTDTDEGAQVMSAHFGKLHDLGVQLAPAGRELCRDAI
ncbi:B12-binding domain-containing radical SAM protein [Streptomyces sp. NPDC002446]